MPAQAVPPTDFWSTLGTSDRAALAACGTPRVYERGHTLFYEGQLADRVLLVRRGRVKVTSTTVTGREVLLAFRGPGDLVGDLAALDGGTRSATIRAVEDIEVMAFAPQDFRDFLAARPGVLLLMLQMLGRRLRDADAKVIEFSAFTTIERVATRLLEFSERFGEEESGTVRIALPLTQDELAGATGSSLESVGRALQTMRSLKCVETRRKEIRILDVQALRALRSER